MKRLSLWSMLMLAGFGHSPAIADSTNAACAVYPAGEDHAEKTIPCDFYQAQGHVVITRSDGVTHDLTPQGDTSGSYLDPGGNRVYRQRGLGDQGLIFRMPTESVYVYWTVERLEPKDDGNPTWPFSTNDYDATALFRCKAPLVAEFSNCPGGILRMENGQASIVVQNQAGEQFTINFMAGYVNATNRKLTARLDNDLWTLEFDNGEVWEIPLAAIEGGQVTRVLQ
jgi:hypothetical protein